MSESWLDRKAALTDTQAFLVLDTQALTRLLRETEHLDPERHDLRETVAELRAQLQVVEHWARYVRANWPQLVSNEGEHAGVREDSDDPIRGAQVRAERCQSPELLQPLPGVRGTDDARAGDDTGNPGAGRG